MIPNQLSYGMPYYRPVKYRGNYHNEQNACHMHQYYDPSIYSPMLNDALASRQPNFNLNQKMLGQKYDYLTNYKRRILEGHDEYLKRDRVERAWWK